MANLVDSYSESNQNTASLHNNGQDFIAQSFTGNGEVLQSAKFYLQVQGSPNGNMYAHIYAHTGTFGTSSKPTGASLAVSGPIAASVLTTSYQLIEFTFTGANKITLGSGTKYCVVLETNNSLAHPNYVFTGQDSSSPTHGGNYAFTNDAGANWSAGADDVIFYVYSDASSLSPSASPSISPSSSVSPSISSSSPSVSPSPSISPSKSPSVSPSVSISPSASPSLSPSVSPSVSASPSAMPARATVLRVAKTGVNAITNSDPEKMRFDSQYGTLKYLSKQAVNISIDASTGDISARGEYAHNLGYYPYAEVFVRVYIGSPAGNYEYCPFVGAGATILYSANYKITTDKITVYGFIDGVSVSVWHFDFLIFVFKNSLQL